MPDWLKSVLFHILPAVQDIVLVVLLARGIALYKLRKVKRDFRQVSLRPVLLWTGSVCGGSFCILVTVLGFIGPPSTVPWPVFEALAVLSFVLILAYCNETVVYNEESFTVKNLFGIKRTFSYGDISGISKKGSDTVLRCGRSRVRLDQMALNVQKFIQFADSCYFRMFKRHIPEIVANAKDPMRGNLDTPWLYLFLYIFCFAGGLLFIILPAYCLRSVEENLPSDAFEIRTSFVSSERVKKNRGTLVLNAAGFEKPFELSWLSGFEVPVPDPDSLCGGTEFLVSVREGKTVYRIEAISAADHSSLLSAYDCNTAYRNSQFAACIFSIVFGVFEVGIAVFGILVGRYPERFPEPFRNLFYNPRSWTSSGLQKGKSHRNT